MRLGDFQLLVQSPLMETVLTVADEQEKSPKCHENKLFQRVRDHGGQVQNSANMWRVEKR